MTKVVSVRFKNRGKNYYFDPNNLSISTGDNVVVETSKGLEYGECSRGNFEVEDDKVTLPLRSVVRIATDEDRAAERRSGEKEAEAFRICAEKIAEHGLEMKLVDVEYNFEGSKILFFFTSDGRVDFRGLVKELAGIFKTRIELRQIGVRDEAKMLGGMGVCGKCFCCSQFLDEFHPVSIKMAKTQNLSLNPTKISGACGRLMCCLKYEQEAYEELVKGAPKMDSYVETPDGNGTITDVNLLRQCVKVRLDSTSGDPAICVCPMKEVNFIKTGKQRRADLVESAANTQQKAPWVSRGVKKEAPKSVEPEKKEAPTAGEKDAPKDEHPKTGKSHRRRRPAGGAKGNGQKRRNPDK